MKSFFKGLAKGILYIIGFPFIIAGLCVAAVVSLLVFLFQFGKLIYLFFTGRTLFSDLEEDIEVKEILARNNPEPQTSSALNMYPSDSPVYGSYASPVQKQINEPVQEQFEEVETPIENNENYTNSEQNHIENPIDYQESTPINEEMPSQNEEEINITREEDISND